MRLQGKPRSSYKDIEDNTSARQIIDTIKSDAKSKQERVKAKKRLHVDKSPSSFKAYQHSPQAKKIIKPQFFKFDNIPAEANERISTPKFAQSFEKSSRPDSLIYQFDSTKNNMISPLGNPFPCESPIAIVSTRNFVFPGSTKALYSPSCEYMMKSPMAWEEDGMRLNSTKDINLTEAHSFFSNGLSSHSSVMEPTFEIKKPIAVSPNTKSR